jgi:hypothetical protein
MSNSSNLNKHLFECELYDEWYKKYKPSDYVKCQDCNKEFIDQLSLNNNHNCKNII